MDEKELEIITQYTEKEKQSRLEHRKQAERKHLECERAAEKAVLERAGPIGAEEQIAELRSKFVHTNFKNAIRLKTMQAQNDKLQHQRRMADIGAATLKAELERCEWEYCGGIKGDAVALHRKRPAARRDRRHPRKVARRQERVQGLVPHDRRDGGRCR